MVGGDTKKEHRRTSETNRESIDTDIPQVASFSETANIAVTPPPASHRRRSSILPTLPGVSVLGEFGKRIQGIINGGRISIRRESNRKHSSNTDLETMHELPTDVDPQRSVEDHHIPGEGRVLEATRYELDQREIDRLLNRTPSGKFATVKNLFSSHSAWRRSRSGRWVRGSIAAAAVEPEPNLHSENPMFDATPQQEVKPEVVNRVPETVQEDVTSSEAERDDVEDDDASDAGTEVCAEAIEDNEKEDKNNNLVPRITTHKESTASDMSSVVDGVGPVSAAPFFASRTPRPATSKKSFYAKVPKTDEGYYYGGSIFTGGSFVAPTKTNVNINSYLRPSQTNKVQFFHGAAAPIKKKKAQWKMVGGRWIRAMVREVSRRLSRSSSRSGSNVTEADVDA